MEGDLFKIEKAIISKLSEHRLLYVKIPEDLLEAIYNIFFLGATIDDKNTSEIYLFYAGVYYGIFIKEPLLAEKYYLMAVEKKSKYAMNNIGLLYENSQNIELAEKYYLMAIENGSICALINLAILYEKQNKGDLAEKYYLMAVAKGKISALEQLALFYRNCNKSELAIEYYLKAIDAFEDFIIRSPEVNELYVYDAETRVGQLYNELACLYYGVFQHNLVVNHLQIAMQKGNDAAIMNLASFYGNKCENIMQIKYLLMAVEKNNKNACVTLNDILLYEFDFEIAIKIQHHLTERNKKKLDKILAYIRDKIDGNFNGRLMPNMDCTKCQENSTVLFLICGHPICIDCFRDGSQCVICCENKNEPNISDMADPESQQRQMLLKKLSQWDYVYIPIPDNELKNIYDLIVNNIVDDTNQSDVYIFYRVIHLYRFNSDFPLAMVNNEILFAKGNVAAIINLGIKHMMLNEYQNAEKYFSRALETGSVEAMYRVARFYDEYAVKKLAKKYYTMAANEYHFRAREWINNKLHKKFSVRLALESESFLDNININRLNKFLVYIYDNILSLLNNNDN